MKISGLWNTPISFAFHIVAKNKFRDMINADPEATGSSISMLNDIEFDERLVYEPTDKLVLNEKFMQELVKNYFENISLFKPSMVERKLAKKSTDFALALYRNDSAYFERIGGIISLIVKNKERFSDVNGDFCNDIIRIKEWWDINDKRERTRPWIQWIFNYIINKYKRNRFYKQSVNHVLHWIYLNGDAWKMHETYNPESWFGYKKGQQLIELYGGNF